MFSHKHPFDLIELRHETTGHSVYCDNISKQLTRIYFTDSLPERNDYSVRMNQSRKITDGVTIYILTAGLDYDNCV